jgi:hypothetical protein
MLPPDESAAYGALSSRCKLAMVRARINVALDAIAYWFRIVILRRKHIRNV